MNSRRSGQVASLSVMAFALALGGCDVDQAPIQRDVYAGMSPSEALQQCAIDWGSQDLCVSIADAKQKETAEKQYAASSGSSHGGGGVFFVHGPGYGYGDRSIVSGSQRIVPQSALNTSALVKPSSISTFSNTGGFRGGISTATAAGRGGFGATGHAAAAASSGGGS